MPRKLSQEEFLERCKKRPEYKPLDEYAGCAVRIKFLHIPCGRTFMMSPGHFFCGENCPFCSKENLARRYATPGEKKFREKCAELHLAPSDNFEYKNSRQNVLVTCTVCGRQQTSMAINIMCGHGCAHCSAVSAKKPFDFKSVLKEKAPDWELVGEYTNARIRTAFRHKKCGKICQKIPYNLIAKPNSCDRCGKSSGEQGLLDFVCDLVAEFYPSAKILDNDRTLLDGTELDLYIPDLKIAFEYDGVYYHSIEKLRTKVKKCSPIQYHLWKTTECLKKGVRLIHIFEDEWIEHPSIVEDKIKAILKVPATKIFARKLKIKEIPSREAFDFLERNHIQGGARAAVSVGLYAGEELIAAQSFVRYTRAKNKENGEWELVRYATKLGTVVIGGFSRCLKWFERGYRPAKIVSFADKRWCSQSDNVYEKNNFRKEVEIPPDYWYTQRQKRFHKFGFRKEAFKKKYPKVYSPDKTERQMAEEAKLLRIYDCGKIRYVKVP